MKKKLKGICYSREKVRKLCLMTKLSLILTFFCLQIQANGFSQRTRLSIKMDNISVKQLFVDIGSRTDGSSFDFDGCSRQRFFRVFIQHFTGNHPTFLLRRTLFPFANHHMVIHNAVVYSFTFQAIVQNIADLFIHKIHIQCA